MGFKLSDVATIDGPVRRAIESLRQYVDRDKPRGVVMVGSYVPPYLLVSATGPGWYGVTGTEYFTAQKGRRYRATYTARAIGGNAGTPCVLGIALFQSSGVAAGTPWVGDHYFASERAYDGVNFQVTFVGDDVQRNLVIAAICRTLGSNTGIHCYSSEWYIEDIGPVR